MKTFQILIEIMTLLSIVAMAIGVIVAIVYSNHEGAIISSIGMIGYLVDVCYKNRRSLFQGEF